MGAIDLSSLLYPDVEMGRQPQGVTEINPRFSYGLVGAWPLRDAVEDISQRSQIKVINVGAKKTIAPFGRAYEFSGSGQYVNLGDCFYSNELSVAITITPSVVDVNARSIWVKRNLNGVANADELHFFYNSTGFGLNAWDSTGSAIIGLAPPYSLSPGKTYHIVVIISSTQASIWVNGALVGTTTRAGTIRDSSSTFEIGAWSVSNANRWFNGKAANAAIWTYPLRESDGRSLSNNLFQLFNARYLEDVIISIPGAGSVAISASGSDEAAGNASASAQIALAGIGVSVTGGNAAPSVAIPLSAAGIAIFSGVAGDQATITIQAAALAAAAAQAGLSPSVLLSAAAAAQASGNDALAVLLTEQAAGAAQASGFSGLSSGAAGGISAPGQMTVGGSSALSVTVGLQAAGSDQVVGNSAGQASTAGGMSASGHGIAGAWAAQSVLINLTAAGFIRAMALGSMAIDVPLGAHGVANAASLAQLGVAGPVRGARLEPGRPHLTTDAVAVAIAATTFEHRAEHV